MSLSESEKTDARRFCGYPLAGAGQHRPTGPLEYRLLNLSVSEEAVARTYLVTLRTLEAAIPAMSEALDTSQAAVWTRNPHEREEREALFASWRRRLCGFLGVPAGPDLANGSLAVALVV